MTAVALVERASLLHVTGRETGRTAVDFAAGAHSARDREGRRDLCSVRTAAPIAWRPWPDAEKRTPLSLLSAGNEPAGRTPA